jgi:undecaprenyl diphosphate synthase
VTQSTFSGADRAARPGEASGPRRRGLHVAIILDGNGRWAEGRGLPRPAGHWVGVEVVRRVVACAPGLGIGTLTLYALSSDNWRRPRAEVRGILTLLEGYLREAGSLARRGVRLRVIGRRDRLPGSLLGAIVLAERATARGRALELRIALDYSGRAAILEAARGLASAPAGPSRPPSRARFERLLARSVHGGAPRDVDLLIRTGGERRLSDFLLWECAYAELYFTPALWPDWGAADLEAALHDFHHRERRFGRLPGQRGTRRGADPHRAAPSAGSAATIRAKEGS